MRGNCNKITMCTTRHILDTRISPYPQKKSLHTNTTTHNHINLINYTLNLIFFTWSKNYYAININLFLFISQKHYKNDITPTQNKCFFVLYNNIGSWVNKSQNCFILVLGVLVFSRTADKSFDVVETPFYCRFRVWCLISSSSLEFNFYQYQEVSIFFLM